MIRLRILGPSGPTGPRLTAEEAVLLLRADPAWTELLRDAYLDPDSAAAADRFRCSAEFTETLSILPEVRGLRIVDLGAGPGLAARAFASRGAKGVVAVEPDRSPVVGLGAVPNDHPRLDRLAAVAGSLPLASESVDVVYGRQVLHHIPDLHSALVECARVLRPGGWFLAVREHVVDDDRQLEAFLRAHPIHRMTGNEHAWPLSEYRSAIAGSGLELTQELGPWDSVVNAFPLVASSADLDRVPALVLARRLGRRASWIGSLAPVRRLLWAWLRRPRPGRLYSFVAWKPVDDA